MSGNQKVGRSHNIMNDNSSFEREEVFKYIEKNNKSKFYLGRN
jgi:hypothetical protein